MRSLFLVFLCCTLLFCQLPQVHADGMWIPDTPEEFTAIAENKQIAYIRPLNETHERIHLFLGVTAIDVSVHNVTIVVPLPSVPMDVSGGRNWEKTFLWDFDLNQIEELGERQHMPTAVKAVLEKTTSFLDLYVGFSTLSPLIYPFFRAGGMTYGGTLGGGRPAGEPVAHYEFEGMTIDVYSIDAGTILQNYLTQNNVTLTGIAASLAEDYSSHYVAVIKAEAFPAIEQNKADLLATYAPTTVKEFRNYVLEHPKFGARYQWLYELGQNFGILAREEASNTGANQTVAGNVKWAMQRLVDSVYAWHTNAQGYKLELTIQVPQNEIYYPLGTGEGWSHPIETTKIFLQLPNSLDAKFNIEPTHETFTAESHYFIWKFEYSNPSNDLRGQVFKAGLKVQIRTLSARVAQGIFDASTGLGFSLLLLLILLAWAVLYMVFQKARVRIGRNEYFLSCVALSVLGYLITIFIAGMFVWYPLLKKEYGKENPMASGITISGLALFIGILKAFHLLLLALA